MEKRRGSELGRAEVDERVDWRWSAENSLEGMS